MRGAKVEFIFNKLVLLEQARTIGVAFGGCGGFIHDYLDLAKDGVLVGQGSAKRSEAQIYSVKTESVPHWNSRIPLSGYLDEILRRINSLLNMLGCHVVLLEAGTYGQNRTGSKLSIHE